MENERKKRRYDRDQLIKSAKTGGDILMYAGSAALMRPQIQKARENQNGILGACAAGAGTILAIGLGGIASKFLNDAIDKAVHFWDDVKPKEQEEESNG